MEENKIKQENQTVGQHGGDKRSYAGIFVVAFGEYQYHRKMAHQRCDDVGAGVAYPECYLSKLG